ncbi:hypothetical protein SMICM17S_07496 [Streptomyces microflavus]
MREAGHCPAERFGATGAAEAGAVDSAVTARPAAAAVRSAVRIVRVVRMVELPVQMVEQSVGDSRDCGGRPGGDKNDTGSGRHGTVPPR